MAKAVKAVATAKPVESKLEFIGKAWKNTSRGGKEFIKITLNNKLEDSYTIGAGAVLMLFNNEKRTGINPNTSKEYRDADYSLAIELA
jgi:uncharacterized protein (DUF736 family)